MHPLLLALPHAIDFLPGPPPPLRPNTDPRCNLPPPSKTGLHPVSSTLKKDAWAFHLADYPDSIFVTTILHIIEFGACIGFSSDEHEQPGSNLKSACEFSESVQADIDAHIALGRTHSPFPTPPFPNFRSSPLGSITKKNGAKRRRIHHLSWPEGTSVNSGIPDCEAYISYDFFEKAVRDLQKSGARSLMAKLDLQDAFKHIPVRFADWHYLGFTWLDQLWYDIVLAFGLRSAPYIFNLFAEALHWIIDRHIPGTIRHYLDDYLPIFPPTTTLQEAENALEWIQALGNQLGLSFQTSKTLGPATCIEFLGLELDSEAMEARLPHDKLIFLRDLLSSWNRRVSCTLRDLQELTGFLQFASQVIPISRAFIRQLIDFSMTFSSPLSRKCISKGARADIDWWTSFTPGWNGVRLLLPDRPVVHIYTDASGVKGLGGIFNNQWFSTRVPRRHRPKDIQFKELLAVKEAVLRWGTLFYGKHIIFHVDNDDIVGALNKLTIQSPPTMQLLRGFLMMTAELNFTFSAVWLSSAENALADFASRFLYSKLFALAPHLNKKPTLKPHLQCGISPTANTPPRCRSTFGMDSHPALAVPTLQASAPSSSSALLTDSATLPPSPHLKRPLWNGFPLSEVKSNQRPSKLTFPMSGHSTSITTFPLPLPKPPLFNASSAASNDTTARRIASPSSPLPSQSSLSYYTRSRTHTPLTIACSQRPAVSHLQHSFGAASSRWETPTSGTQLSTSLAARSSFSPISTT